jgi:hypothetical protein
VWAGIGLVGILEATFRKGFAPMRQLLTLIFTGFNSVRHTSFKQENGSMIRASRLGQMALGLLVVFAGSACLQAADLNFTVQQVGADVVTSFTGFVNTTASTTNGNASGTGLFRGSFFQGGSVIIFGPQNSYTNYTGLNGSGALGSGSQTFADINTGTLSGIISNGSSSYLLLPNSYVSGSSITGTSTYTGKTLSDLGMTVGTYNWSWGSGANAGTAQLTISAVPEPSTYALAAIATGVMAAVARRRKARTA